MEAVEKRRSGGLSGEPARALECAPQTTLTERPTNARVQTSRFLNRRGKTVLMEQRSTGGGRLRRP